LIDKNSPLPLYFQLEEEIKQLIESEQFTPGTLLPSERELSEKYKISRMTVRQAITNLANKGYLYREKGKGTFVAEKKFEQDLQGLTSFTEDMKSRGLTPGSKLIKFGVIDAFIDVKKKLMVEENEPIFQIQRIRLANEQPIALETSYIPVKFAPELNEDILKGSIYQYVENQSRLKIGSATQILESSVVNQFEIEHLNLKKGDPVLLIERHTLLEDGRPLEIVKSSYRADKYKFTINIKRGFNYII
jgi:GntR family transcriptional regulator